MSSSSSSTSKIKEKEKEKEKEKVLNLLYIEMFVNSYANVIGEPSRDDLTTTSTQRNWSIENPTSTNSTIQAILNYVKNKWGSEDEPFPVIIDIEVVVESMKKLEVKNQELGRGSVLAALKTVYGYCTGGLIINTNNDVLTGTRGPRAEIEHILAWRTMLAIGGDIAKPPSGFKKGDGGGRDVPQLTFEEEKELIKYEAIIKHYGFDPTSHSSCFSTPNMRKVFEKMKLSPPEKLTLIINMERIILHGMWYSCRLWNQIKSNACLFKLILDKEEQKLMFFPSSSRIQIMVEMLLCYMFVDDETIYANYTAFSENKEIIRVKATEVMEKIPVWRSANDGDEVLHTRDGRYSLHYLKGKPVPSVRIIEEEFNWLKQICNAIIAEDTQTDTKTRTMSLPNRTIVQDRLVKNIVYVGKYLCEDLNTQIYERAYFQSQRQIAGYEEQKQAAKASGPQRSVSKGHLTAFTGSPLGRKKTSTSAPSSQEARKGNNAQAKKFRSASSSTTQCEPMMKIREKYIKEYNSLIHPRTPPPSPALSSSPPRKQEKRNSSKTTGVGASDEKPLQKQAKKSANRPARKYGGKRNGRKKKRKKKTRKRRRKRTKRRKRKNTKRKR